MNSRKFNSFNAVCILLLLSFYSSLSLALGPVYVGGDSETAIRGYDTVAYFTEGKPVKGSAQYTTEYKGATWRFSSKDNLAKFTGDPEKYAPQYGGYCAYAVSQDKTASIKPPAFTIHEGKLYLNYSKGVRKIWLRDMEEHILRANENWPGVLN